MKIILLLITAGFLTLSVFSFEISEIEKSWKEKGYTVIEEENLKIVELSFQFDNVLSVNETSKEVYIITYLNQNKPKPDSGYINDIEKALRNSSFSEVIVSMISNRLKSQETWENSFLATDSLQVNTMLYDQMTPILKVIFLEKQAVNQTPVETIKEEPSDKTEDFEALKRKSEDLETQNKILKLETEMLSNKNAVLEKTNQNLKDDLEKHKNLSTYKDRTISGLKNTIDRYVSIEKQKNETIKSLQLKMKNLEDEYSKRESEYQKTLQDLESEIKTLKLTINKQTMEIELINETEQQLLERIKQLKSFNDQQIVSTETKFEPVDTKKTPENDSDKSNANEKPFLTPESTKVNQIPTQEKESISKTQSEGETNVPEKNNPSPLLKKVIIYEKGEKTVTIENEYNDDKELIREQIRSAEGKTLLITEIKYNSSGQVKERVNYENTQMVGKNEFQYDDQNRLLRVFSYNQDTLIYYTVLEYDEKISNTDPVKVKYYRNNQLDLYEENEFNQVGKLTKTVQKKPDGTTISQKKYEYDNDELQKIVFYQSGKKTSYQINGYDENGLQKTQKTYNAEDQIISEMVLIWDEVE